VRFFFKRIDRLIVATASRVFADSQSQCSLLEKEGVVFPGKISVLGDGSICGVDPTRFSPDQDGRKDVRTKLAVSDDCCVFLFVGRLTRDKGVFDLLHAFAGLAEQQSNVALWVVGPDEDHLLSELKFAAGTLNPCIRWIGPTFKPENFMAAADVLVLPSYREGFGMVILEAAACGIPSVAYRIDGVTDAVLDGGTGILVSKGDVAALRDAMCLMVADAALRTRLGHSACKRARDAYSDIVVTSAWVQFYNHIFEVPVFGPIGESRAVAKASPRVVLVTGATGFVGRATVERLVSDGWLVRAVARKLPPTDDRDAKVEWISVGEIDNETDWSGHLAGCDAVVHLVARQHLVRNQAGTTLEEYRHTNVAITRAFAEASAKAGVRRMLFLSSLKVNGDERSKPYDEQDIPAPADAYATSKCEAECVLRKISMETSMEMVILRPPLIYGPGVKANFLHLLQTVNFGIPLPLASIPNLRSLLFVGNLVDAIALCLNAPAAAGQTYLLSDGQDVSTADLVRLLARALRRRAYLFPCPTSLLHFAGRLFRREAAIDRLAGSLQVDSQRIQRELHWTPPYTLEQGMEKTASWFRGQTSR
jgi:nucleoside-diphosphate-sugar epimerase